LTPACWPWRAPRRSNTDISAPSGTVIRNLEGRRIGARYTDLRSRGTNPNAEGVGIIIKR
jgi:hypothetical protein